jgi:asparagine synthase (glutamine-hydrolysing)
LAYKRFAWIPHVLIKPFLLLPFEYWGKQFLYRASHKLQDWYIGNASIFKPEEIKNLWKKDDTRHVYTLDHLYRHATGSDSEKMQYIDIHTWLVGDILAKADKMTMANSLELRVPFLDKEVFSLARTLPDVLKWNKGTTKYILREAFKNIIPEATRHRPKLGFPTPLRAWLTKDRTDVYDVIRACAYIKEHMNIQEVESLIQEHVRGTKDNSRKIYILYMLALWYQVFFEKQ